MDLSFHVAETTSYVKAMQKFLDRLVVLASGILSKRQSLFGLDTDA